MSRSRTQKRGRYARCNHCRFHIVWFALRGDWRPFDPKPVDGRTHIGGAAYPVTGKTAWRRVDLVEEFMANRQLSSEQAEDDVYAMAWHVLHACPPPQPPGNRSEVSDPSRRNRSDIERGTTT